VPVDREVRRDRSSVLARQARKVMRKAAQRQAIGALDFGEAT
jgi:hypothetical protein